MEKALNIFPSQRQEGKSIYTKVSTGTITQRKSTNVKESLAIFTRIFGNIQNIGKIQADHKYKSHSGCVLEWGIQELRQIPRIQRYVGITSQRSESLSSNDEPKENSSSCIYVTTFKKEDDVYIKQYQKQIEACPYQEDMEDLVVNEERKHHLIMVIYENEGDRDKDKYLLYSKR